LTKPQRPGREGKFRYQQKPTLGRRGGGTGYEDKSTSFLSEGEDSKDGCQGERAGSITTEEELPERLRLGHERMDRSLRQGRVSREKKRGIEPIARMRKKG